MKLKFSVTKKPDLVTRFSALIDAENLKIFSKSFATSAGDAEAASAFTAEVAKVFEEALVLELGVFRTEKPKIAFQKLFFFFRKKLVSSWTESNRKAFSFFLQCGKVGRSSYS